MHAFYLYRVGRPCEKTLILFVRFIIMRTKSPRWLTSFGLHMDPHRAAFAEPPADHCAAATHCAPDTRLVPAIGHDLRQLPQATRLFITRNHGRAHSDGREGRQRLVPPIVNVSKVYRFRKDLLKRMKAGERNCVSPHIIRTYRTCIHIPHNVRDALSHNDKHRRNKRT